MTLSSRLLSGVHWRRKIDGETVSPWVPQMLAGIDNGYFGPESAAWAVNGGLSSMIAGIRALLVQALHPGALAGVHDHSRYREDTMGRLNGTIRWVAMTTFGDRALAQHAAAVVGRMHAPVSGTYVGSDGAPHSYSAADPELLRWVHHAFTDAFIQSHMIWGTASTEEADRYVREWARAGELMGVVDPATSMAQLNAEMRAATSALRTDARVADIVSFLRRPKLPPGIRLVYPVLFAGAVASLPQHYRLLLGLTRPRWPAITACRVLLVLIGIALGRRSPSERAARVRASRLNAEAAGARPSVL